MEGGGEFCYTKNVYLFALLNFANSRDTLFYERPHDLQKGTSHSARVQVDIPSRGPYFDLYLSRTNCIAPLKEVPKLIQALCISAEISHLPFDGKRF